MRVCIVQSQGTVEQKRVPGVEGDLSGAALLRRVCPTCGAGDMRADLAVALISLRCEGLCLMLTDTTKQPIDAMRVLFLALLQLNTVTYLSNPCLLAAG